MRLASIRNRLTLWYSAVFCLGSLLLSVTIWAALHHMLYHELDATLHQQMQGLQEYIRSEAAENPSTLPHEIDEYTNSLPAAHILFIADNNGGVIYRNGVQAAAASLPDSGEKLVQVGPTQFLVFSTNMPLRDHRFHIVLGLRSEEISHISRLLGGIVLAVAPLFIICGVVGGRWLSSRALKPVQEITRKAHAIGLANLSERLPVPNTDDEIQLLTETWNDMLRRLELAFNRVTHFTADASHELRTPLAVIQLAAETALRRSRSGDEYREALLRIRDQVGGMTDLVESLLFLARVDANDGANSFERSFVNPAEVASESIDVFEALALQKSVSLINEIEPCDQLISGNTQALQRLVLILLDNALKYTPSGGRIIIRMARTPAQIDLSVRDTGIGIEEDELPFIFERFYRADPSRARDSGGHGLGLAIAQAIANAHGSEIKVVSKAGIGSEFRISFPICVRPASATKSFLEREHALRSSEI